jgi:predicted negative regulator of RcsB-dependent stress response
VADHLSEEEQIEAFKRWWAENGLQMIATVVLLVGGYFGWQFWQDNQQAKMEEASDLYVEMIDIVSSQTDGGRLSLEKEVAITRLADQLKADFSGSGYAQFAALLKAKLAVDNTELDLAAAELQWAMDNDPTPETERLVRLRLARVEAGRGNIDTALQMVQGIDSAEMKSAYEEAKGDFYLQQGNAAAAYTAYESALAANKSTDAMIANILQLKMSQVKPAELLVTEPIIEEPLAKNSETDSQEGDSQ